MIRVAHLSDFHLKKETLFDNYKEFITPFLEDIKSLHEEKPIDLVILSGDLLDKGGNSFDSAKNGFEVFMNQIITPILSELNLESNRLILTAGNHDVDRELDSAASQIGYSDIFNDYSKLNDYIVSEEKDGSNKIQPYNDFIKNLYENSDSHFSHRFFSVHHLNINNYKIGIVSFNSSWRCHGDEKKEDLFIGEAQVRMALSKLEEVDVKIAVSHHPLEELSEVDREKIELQIYREFDLLFHGHKHSNDNSSLQKNNKGIFISRAQNLRIANSSNDSKKFSNGYKILDIDLSNLKLECRNRIYSNENQEFVSNTLLNGDKGVSEYELITSDEAKRFLKSSISLAQFKIGIKSTLILH